MIRRIFSHSKAKLIRLFKKYSIHIAAFLLGLSPAQVIDVLRLIKWYREGEEGLEGAQ